MGCGASSINSRNIDGSIQANVDASQDLVPYQALEKPQPESVPSEVYMGVSLDLPVLCRDEFRSKYTNALMYRWRPAVVIQIEGEAQNKVLIHYVGWEDSFDVWIDMNKEGFKLAPRTLLPAEQCKSGEPLNDEQLCICMDYFRFGKQFITPEFENVDLSVEERGSTERRSSETRIASTDNGADSTAVAPNPLPQEVQSVPSEDPDATFIIPTKRLPDPKIISTPAPVVATKRTKTPGSLPDDSSGGSNSVTSTPSRMMVPPGVQTTPIQSLPPPQQSTLLLRPPLSVSSGTGNLAAISALNSDNPHYVDEMVDILDIFYKKGSTTPSQKWRPAEIIDVQGDYITIHYLNWDSKYDERLHYVNDSSRISVFGSNTTRRTSSGASAIDAPANAKSSTLNGTRPFLTQPHRLRLPSTDLESDAEASTSTTRRLPAQQGNTSDKGGTGSGPSVSGDSTPALTEAQSSFTKSFHDYRVNKLAAVNSLESQTPSGSSAASAIIEVQATSSAITKKPDATQQKHITAEGKPKRAGKILSSLFGTKKGSGSKRAKSPRSGDSATDTDTVVTQDAEDDDNNQQTNKNDNSIPVAVAEPLQDENERDEEEIARREQEFLEKLESKGLHVFAIEGDGNCLFRAVSHQLYLNQDMHEELRACCVEHLIRHRKRFEMFCEGDFEEYVKEMSKPGVWGDDLEIRALEEITDRVITIYSSTTENVLEPINNNFEEKNLLRGVPPLTLSYHGSSHYNSIYDERYPLPLVHRKSRLLLRSRTKLNMQDQTGSANSSNNSITARSRSKEDMDKDSSADVHKRSSQAGESTLQSGYSGGLRPRSRIPSMDSTHGSSYGQSGRYPHLANGHYLQNSTNAVYGAPHVPPVGSFGNNSSYGMIPAPYPTQHQLLQQYQVGNSKLPPQLPVYPVNSSSGEHDQDGSEYDGASTYSSSYTKQEPAKSYIYGGYQQRSTY